MQKKLHNIRIYAESLLKNNADLTIREMVDKLNSQGFVRPNGAPFDYRSVWRAFNDSNSIWESPYGVKPKRDAREKTIKISERDKKILSLRHLGVSLKSIGLVYGISSERVRQICKNAKGCSLNAG